MKRVYLLLAFLGFVLLYYFLVSFLISNGLDLALLFRQLFSNDISTFSAADLIVTAVVFWVLLFREAQKYHMKYWWVFAATTFGVGPSFAMPLFLYFRESRIEALAS